MAAEAIAAVVMAPSERAEGVVPDSNSLGYRLAGFALAKTEVRDVYVVFTARVFVNGFVRLTRYPRSGMWENIFY
jgi:hypothetical protein